jgi:GxxExxY protein
VDILYNMATPDKPLEQYAFAVIGAAIEVHRALGPGYLEAVYEEGLCHELELRHVPYVSQHPIGVTYKGKLIGEGRIDILVAKCLIVTCSPP